MNDCTEIKWLLIKFAKEVCFKLQMGVVASGLWVLIVVKDNYFRLIHYKVHMHFDISYVVLW